MKEGIGNGDHHHEDFLLNAIRMGMFLNVKLFTLLIVLNFSLCEAFSEGEESSCKYGAQCVEAHGMEELTEWKERFEYRRMKLQRASENKLYGKSYTEQLLER